MRSGWHMATYLPYMMHTIQLVPWPCEERQCAIWRACFQPKSLGEIHPLVFKLAFLRTCIRLPSYIVDKEFETRVNLARKVSKIERIDNSTPPRHLRVSVFVIFGCRVCPHHGECKKHHLDACRQSVESIGNICGSPIFRSAENAMTLQGREHKALIKSSYDDQFYTHELGQWLLSRQLFLRQSIKYEQTIQCDSNTDEIDGRDIH